MLYSTNADLAHPVEQRIRNAQVVGSSPTVGFFCSRKTQILSIPGRIFYFIVHKSE